MRFIFFVKVYVMINKLDNESKYLTNEKKVAIRSEEHTSELQSQ